MKNVINVASFTSMKVMIHCTPIKSTENPLHQQCGKPYFSNTRQNGEWTEISTGQNEIELAMFGE